MERDCEVCLQALAGPTLDFGFHPLCDDLVRVGNPTIAPRYHQEIVLCSNCLTAQQLHQVPKEILFKSDYHYRASLTKDVLHGMSNLVDQTLLQVREVERPLVVLDVGCNDGSLLGIFKEKTSCLTIGIDPTDAILEHSGKIDLMIQSFFDEATAQRVLDEVGFPDVITFTNVFAHIEDFQGLIKALSLLLGSETLLVIENHYLGSIIEGEQFDTFYHEHPRTYSAKSFEVIASSLGLSIRAIEFPSRYGGNIRVTMSQTATNPVHLVITPNEELFPQKFVSLQQKYESWLIESKKTLNSLMNYGKLRGKALPGRAVMLISALGLTSAEMPFVYEQPNSPKIGFYVPGTNIEIVSDACFPDSSGEIILLWSWHIADEIIEYLKSLGIHGEIWTPLPVFEKVVTI
jgi:hypothetical protein